MVRDYLQATDTSGQWSSSLIGSNIAAASHNLQRWTGRQFEPQGSNSVVTKKFSTHGRSFLHIPDLRVGSNTTVTRHGSALTADENYYFIPDRMEPGVFTAIQLPGLRAYDDYRSFPEWFDRNYDNWLHRGRYADIPNDLHIASQWGHAVYPAPLEHATKVLAGFYTIRPDALLSGARQTPEGNVFDLSRLPLEVQDFIRDWKLADYY